MRKIYKPKCEDLDVKMNSGVKELLMTAPPCFCSLQSVNFRNFLLGNRGVQALWPLLRYARALKSLNLAGNDIHDDGARHILAVLEADYHVDVGGLEVIDLSKNPITGSLAAELMAFNTKRKDVILLGLADTNLPMVKRQKILRQCLTKFAGVEAHVMLEAWRLAADPRDFVDRELFIQCERIVQGTHGEAIYDMMAQEKNRNQGWHDDDDWEDDFLEVNDSDDLRHLMTSAQDGFAGLDDDEQSSVAQASEGGRDTALSFASGSTRLGNTPHPASPTPPPTAAKKAPYLRPNMKDSKDDEKGRHISNHRQSWALRRRNACSNAGR